MNKEVAIVFNAIFPEEDKNKSKKDQKLIENNLINQIKMSSIYLSHFKDKIHIIYLSNRLDLIDKLLNSLKIDNTNSSLIEISQKDLRICNEQKDERFQYAFSKLDTLTKIYKFINLNYSIRHIIISDIDVLFFGIENILNFSKSVKSIAAINYRDEHEHLPYFDEAMEKLIKLGSIELQNKSYKKKNYSWINSGFIVIEREIVKDIIKLKNKLYKWMNLNKNYILNSCNHWGDEIIFSAIFNIYDGINIKNHKSKIARFLWTCSVPLPFWLNPFNLPSHLHLPAIKWREQYMLVLIALGRYRITRRFSAVFLNIWSIDGRINNLIKSLIVYKIAIKFVKIIEKLIILVL